MQIVLSLNRPIHLFNYLFTYFLVFEGSFCEDDRMPSNKNDVKVSTPFKTYMSQRPHGIMGRCSTRSAKGDCSWRYAGKTLALCLKLFIRVGLLRFLHQTR